LASITQLPAEVKLTIPSIRAQPVELPSSERTTGLVEAPPVAVGA
jgi:hypothetical protein